MWFMTANVPMRQQFWIYQFQHQLSKPVYYSQVVVSETWMLLQTILGWVESLVVWNPWVLSRSRSQQLSIMLMNSIHISSTSQAWSRHSWCILSLFVLLPPHHFPLHHGFEGSSRVLRHTNSRAYQFTPVWLALLWLYLNSFAESTSPTFQCLKTWCWF